jgi:hypothetical protein
VEAAGKSILYDEGIRSYQLSIRAAIDNWWVEKQYKKVKQWALFSAATHQAADYFGVPVIGMKEATVAMDLWNIRCNLDDWSWYRPESREVSGMPADAIVELALEYFPEHEKEVTWEDLLKKSV